MTVCGSQDGKIQLLTITKDVALVEFMYLLFTRMPSEPGLFIVMFV